MIFPKIARCSVCSVSLPDRNAPDDLVTINSPGVQLHSWLRRAASKVTVAFDGSGLYANVQIYIENVILKDIPKTCSLGNPNTRD